MDFNDGNLRSSISADLAQRLVALPTYKMTGIVELNTSANSRSNGSSQCNWMESRILSNSVLVQISD